MSRDAFQRARRFLNFRWAATWSALAISVGLGFLYVLILGLVGLGVSLIASRGELRDISGQLVTDISRDSWFEDHFDAQAREQITQQLKEGKGVGFLSLAYGMHQRDAELAWLVRDVVVAMDWTRDNTTALAQIVLLTVFCATLWAVFRWLLYWCAASATVEATHRLRRGVYQQTSRLGNLVFRAQGVNEAISIFTRHLETVQEGLYTWLTNAVRQPVLIVLLVLFALAIEWIASGQFPLLSLAIVLFAVLAIWIGRWLADMFERRAIAIKQHAGEQLALLQESLQMMRLVRGYQMEIFNQARVERQLLTCGNASRDHYQGQALYRSAMLLFGVVVVAILTSVAGWKIMNHQLGLGASVTIILTIVSLYAPTLGAIRSRRTVQRAEESASMLFGFLDRRADVGQVVGAKLLPPMSRLLEFDGVVLREPGGSKFLLDHISLTIRAGDKVAFVGQDEREKQAIISLIPRFLDPEEGELRIDGNKLKLVTLESLRMQVAVVLQQNLIFNDTVANNIRCGDTAQALPRIIEAAKVAHAHQFIQKLPKGYDTRIGDLGFNCSPIQRFQIALARAVLRDPAILVIEEPTGGVDDDYRALLEDTYRRFLPGRTVIFLPHIMSTLRLADCIFLFQKGKIEVAGSHRDLLKTNELYRHLQYLEFNDFQDQGA